MSEPVIEDLGEHHYLAHFGGGEETAEFRFRSSREILERLGLQESDEPSLIHATAAFLLSRQSAIDLPAVIDLEDVIAGYDDYTDEIRSGLG